MNRSARVAFVIVTLSGLLAAMHGRFPGPAASDPAMPAPTEGPGEAGSDFSARRDAWIAGLHRAAPGVDWRAMDEQARAEKSERRQVVRAALLDAAVPTSEWSRLAIGGIAGQWSERGSSNQAGRVLGAFLDQANNRLTAYAAGGQIWRADRASLNWTSANDTIQLRPTGAGYLERLSNSERLLVMTDAPAAIRYSDNGGISWSTASGGVSGNPWYGMALAARDPAGSEVYSVRVHYDDVASDWRARLHASTNRGSSFVDLGFVGERSQVALFSPREVSTTMYLLAGTQLYTITPGTHARVLRSTVPLSPVLAADDLVVLTGGRDSSSGQDFLYAMYSRNGRTDVYRSIDSGLSWVERSDVPTTLFGNNSAEASPQFVDRVYAGGVNLYRSSDGAQSWQLVNEWGEYYAAPASKLHADIPNVDIYVNGGVDRIFVSTDGGLYESTDNLLTVSNLSLRGLNVSQYYTSYTVRAGGDHILVGAQDQGLQKMLNPGNGAQQAIQTISGDYAHLVSGNNGASVWMVYPGFAMLDSAPAANNQSGLRFWDFSDNAFTGWYFLPPLAADPGNGNRVLLAGGRIGGGNSQRVIELNYNGSSISASQDSSFDFASPVTALAFSANGQTRYAMTEGRDFFRKLAGGNWTELTASGLPPHQYLYGNKILVDPSNPMRIYVAGAGYSNPGVFVSNAEGQNFVPMANGLPSTMVFDLAISADGQQLFAATELGPFWYDRQAGTWIDISGATAPEQTWWDVDYIDSTRTARFSTYGRGIWDFVLSSEGVFANGFE